ncbi:MAG: YhbY family RNA-binding protein [Oscillospiraceae bacterium]|nr:YhbY family RNA-binding protein [Oscillospiraceae bacterium]
MLTSKQRSDLRSQANTMEVTLMVGKGGVSESLISQAELLLESHELVKGRVLESAMMTAREVSDAICEQTGADGVSCVGYTFVIWRKSRKLEEAKKAKEKAAAAQKKKVNPVKAGRQKRKAAARAEKERKAQYFHDEAVKAAIERRKQFYQE